MNESTLQEPVPVPKKSNKTWIIVAVVLLILCCLCSLIGGGAGYYFIQNSDQDISFDFGNNSAPAEKSEEAPAQPQEKPSQATPKPAKTTEIPVIQLPQASEAGKDIRKEDGGYAFKTIQGYKFTLDNIVPGAIPMWDKDIDILKCLKEGPFISLVGWSPKTDESIDENAKIGIDNFIIGHKKGTIISDQRQTFVSIAELEGKAYDIDYEVPDIGKIKFRMILVEVNPMQRFTIQCYSPVDSWDKTLADCAAVTNSVTFFDIKAK
ncbi:MAG: hypothetical protein WCG34_01555 [Leptolinea sp.]